MDDKLILLAKPKTIVSYDAGVDTLMAALKRMEIDTSRDIDEIIQELERIKRNRFGYTLVCDGCISILEQLKIIHTPK